MQQETQRLSPADLDESFRKLLETDALESCAGEEEWQGQALRVAVSAVAYEMRSARSASVTPSELLAGRGRKECIRESISLTAGRLQNKIQQAKTIAARLDEQL